MINSNQFKQPWPVIPFGLCTIAAYVENCGHGVSVLDLCFSEDTRKEIRNSIDFFEPDVIGISIRNIDNSAAYKTLFLLDEVKVNVIDHCKRYFSGPIVIGGPSVGISGSEMLEFFGLEYAIIGDGELAIGEFLKRLETGRPLKDCPGLVIRKDGKIIKKNEPCLVPDLNRLPRPKPDIYVDVEKYASYHCPIQIQTKRGCALNCYYCTYNRIEGTEWRLRDPELVAEDIDEIAQDTGLKNIEFVDSCFNIPLEHCKNILKACIKRNLKLNFRTMGLNPGAVDEELVRLLKKSGFTDIDCGVESGSDATLKGLNKNFKKDDIYRAARLLHKYKVPVTWYLLLGGPHETEETLMETFATMDDISSKWDLVNIGIGLRIYKGSPAVEAATQQDPKVTSDNFLRPVAYQPKALDLDDLKRITKTECLKRPNFYMYDEDEKMPLFVWGMLAKLFRTFASKQPVWKAWILQRKLQQIFGILYIKRSIYRFKISQGLKQQGVLYS